MSINQPTVETITKCKSILDYLGETFAEGNEGKIRFPYTHNGRIFEALVEGVKLHTGETEYAITYTEEERRLLERNKKHFLLEENNICPHLTRLGQDIISASLTFHGMFLNKLFREYTILWHYWSNRKHLKIPDYSGYSIDFFPIRLLFGESTYWRQRYELDEKGKEYSQLVLSQPDIPGIQPMEVPMRDEVLRCIFDDNPEYSGPSVVQTVVNGIFSSLNLE